MNSAARQAEMQNTPIPGYVVREWLAARIQLCPAVGSLKALNIHGCICGKHATKLENLLEYFYGLAEDTLANSLLIKNLSYCIDRLPNGIAPIIWISCLGLVVSTSCDRFDQERKQKTLDTVLKLYRPTDDGYRCLLSSITTWAATLFNHKLTTFVLEKTKTPSDYYKIVRDCTELALFTADHGRVHVFLRLYTRADRGAREHHRQAIERFTSEHPDSCIDGTVFAQTTGDPYGLFVGNGMAFQPKYKHYYFTLVENTAGAVREWAKIVGASSRTTMTGFKFAVSMPCGHTVRVLHGAPPIGLRVLEKCQCFDFDKKAMLKLQLARKTRGGILAKTHTDEYSWTLPCGNVEQAVVIDGLYLSNYTPSTSADMKMLQNILRDYDVSNSVLYAV